MCKRWNWEINALKLQEKQNGLQVSPLLEQLFSNLSGSISPIDKSNKFYLESE